ncbi:MAG: N-acetyltransferase [Magnetovibrio sp.]|nr:N-acetyltransferase [Magnetovibrio sp.]
MSFAARDIRQSTPADLPGIERLYVAAFPDEDLIPVVRELLNYGPDAMSLVGCEGSDVIGHIGLTMCTIAGCDERVALLAPLVVSPPLHKQGIGTALVEAGFQRLKNADIGHVYVLGDPAYYSRFGFQVENKITPPYPLPKEWLGAWQSVVLNGSERPDAGQFCIPKFWQHVELWTS